MPGSMPGDIVRVTVSSGEKTLSSGRETRRPLLPQYSGPHLWSPRIRSCYDLHVTLERRGRRSTTPEAIRHEKRTDRKDGKGITRILLNGRSSCRLDRSTRDSGRTASTLPVGRGHEERHRDDEDARIQHGTQAREGRAGTMYYWADRLGLLVWQDMPSGTTRPEGKTQFEAELGRLVETKRNHPSIIMWWYQRWVGAI